MQYSSDFFHKTDVVSIAQSLLGATLISSIDGKITSGIISETEAYRAPEDKASHAYNGRRTARTETMFGPAAHAYIYLCYGIHHLFNVVTGPIDTPHAVLIRAIRPLDGIETMVDRRKIKNHKQLTSGPGKWTQAFGISKNLNGLNLLDKNSPIKLLPPVKSIDPSRIIITPRVGINYAEEWIDMPWRFILTDQN